MGKNKANRKRETLLILGASFGAAFGATFGAIVDSVSIPSGVSVGVIAGILVIVVFGKQMSQCFGRPSKDEKNSEENQ